MVKTHILAGLLPLTAAMAAPSDLAQLDFFEKKIRPVLVEHCYECHSATAKHIRGGLLLDTRDGVLKGGDSGPALVPGNPRDSLLIIGIRHEDKDPDMAMPPKKDRLPDHILADFEEWVRMGAPDPRTGPTRSTAWDPEKAASHWAFKPVVQPAVPQVSDPKRFIQNPVDAFILAELQKRQLAPSPKASKANLIRRVSFDLTGLPPTAAEVVAFVSDSAPDAYEKLVDRLLASPQYGERWARHWLDVARYADTTGDRVIGKLRAPVYSHAWTYRDYVIRAFNQDLPYDRFILEQIAADRLPETEKDKAPLAALGFLTLGKRFMGNINDVIDDRIDVVTKGLMGLTGACARCHDHKFDPIPTRDYYGLHGIFASSEEPDPGPLLSEPVSNEVHQDYLAQRAKITKELEEYTHSQAARLTAGMLEQAGEYLLTIQEAGNSSSSFRNIARDRGLKAEVAAVWQEQVRSAAAAQSKRKDPLLHPWLAFATLKPEQFAEKAPSVLSELAATPGLNPVLIAGITQKGPSSIRDVAAAYTECLGQLHKALQLPEFVSRSRTGIDTAKTQSPLSEPDMERLRQDVFAPDSCMVPEERAVAKVFGVQFSTPQAQIRAKFATLDQNHPGAPQRAMALVDRAKPLNSPVFIRGEPGNRGPVVPRHFPTLLGGSEQEAYTKGSGRLELARSIASRQNPLTARVLVNRVWQWHFGQGIVRTVSDFGTRSEAPTHPELLDWMAAWFMDHGWSLKQLHRLLVTSGTYQQDSRPTDRGLKLDPTNQSLWRANIQRLDFEQLRDTLLSFGGNLDLYDAGGAPFLPSAGSGSEPGSKRSRSTQDTWSSRNNSNRRTVYAMIDRASLPEMFNTFDFANPDISTGERVLTTVPQQALFLLNSPFVGEQVRRILKRPDFPKDGAAPEKVRFLFELILQRRPQPAELEDALRFIDLETANPEVQAEVPAVEARSGKNGPRKPESAPILTPWERYTQVLLMTNELIYLE